MCGVISAVRGSGSGFSFRRREIRAINTSALVLGGNAEVALEVSSVGTSDARRGRFSHLRYAGATSTSIGSFPIALARLNCGATPNAASGASLSAFTDKWIAFSGGL